MTEHSSPTRLREIALDHAVKSARDADTPDDVVAAAEKYRTFLTSGNRV